jgi:trimethylguanosine synthase
MAEAEITDLASMGLPASFGKRKNRSKKNNNTKKSDEPRRGTMGFNSKGQSKYFQQRYQYFSLFDYGIMIDSVGWYSVTPEEIAVHVAKRCACDVIIDAFCGVGGNTIQFAKTCNYVIAVELDPVRLACARHNATIYGVAHKIEFVLGSFMDVLPRAKADVIYLAPPWGGPDYQTAKEFDIETMIPMNGSTLYRQAKSVTPNICYQLPRNVNKPQVANLANLTALASSSSGGSLERALEGPELCEIEDNYLGDGVKMCTAYFGDLIKSDR